MKSDKIYLTKLSLKETQGNYPSWFNDMEVCKYNSHGGGYTKEMAQDYVRSLQDDPGKEVWAVYLVENNVHIGNISLQKIDLKNKSAEIAYIFGEKQYWGRGYAAGAGRLLLTRAFKDLKLHRIYFGTHIENTAMQKLGKKLGFKKEGLLKEAQFKNDKFNDVVIYALLESEYEIL